MRGKRARELRRLVFAPVMPGTVLDGFAIRDIAALGKIRRKKLRGVSYLGDNRWWMYRQLKKFYKKQKAGGVL